MTDPIVALDSTRLTVEPGGQVRTTVTVRNPGSIVEGFAITVVGATVAGWADVLPEPLVQVYPGQAASAVVVFTAPGGTGTRTGSYPFGVRAESVIDSSSAAVAEGDLDVGRVFGLQSKLTPVTSTGRWRGRHRMEITNWGNAQVRLRLVASDPDERLAFLVTPEVLDVPLGGGAQARLKVKTRRPFLRGTPVRLPFQVVGEPDPPETPTGPPSALPDPRRATVDGALTQRPILSRTTVAAGTLVVMALAGLTAFSLLRPGDQSRPDHESEGPPPRPAPQAEAVDSQQISLSWPGLALIEKYNVFQVSKDGTMIFPNPVEVDGAANVLTLGQLTPDTEYCYVMEAVRGRFVSRQTTPPACATTASPPEPTATEGTPPAVSTESGASTEPSSPSTVTSAPGQETFSATEFIATVALIPVEQPEAQAQAEDKAQELSTAADPALVLLSTDFPDMGLIPGTPFNPSFVVYAGPFPTEAAATTYCLERAADPGNCFAIQPAPNG